MAHAKESSSRLPTVYEGDDNELLPGAWHQRQSGAKYLRPSIGATFAIGASCLIGALSCGALLRASGLAALGAGSGAATSEQPLSVRELLEGGELASVAADNLMVVGGAAAASAGGKAHVQAKVKAALQNISLAIHAQDPEAHRKLNELKLSREQQEAAMNVVRKFSDARMLGLTRDVADAVRESVEEGDGADVELQRRLAERLAPKLAVLQQLREEMYPGTQDELDVPMGNDWHAKMQVDLGAPSASAPATRRLQAGLDSEDVDGVRAQAHTLLKTLEWQLGDNMPKAPARMLSSSDEEGGGKLSFMMCVTKAVTPPNPVKMAKCFTDNISDVIKMMKGFMTGKMR